MVSLQNLIEEIVEQELDEVNSVAAGNVAATGVGGPLGGNMSPAHKKMWSGDKPKRGNKLGENVLDKMGLQKATSNVRRGALSGEVYMDRHDNDKENTKKVMAKVAKNLNKKPYSSDPPMMGLREGVAWLIEAAKLLDEAKIDVAIQAEQDPEIKKFLEFVKAENVSPKFIPWLIKHAKKEQEQWYGMGPAEADVANMAIGLRKFEALAQANRLQKKDINAYASFQELWQAVNALENAPSATALKKAAKSETEVFYSDAEYLILEPQSMAAACHYGQGTKWCISATQAQNYFDSYTRDGAKFLFVINKKTGDKTAIAHMAAGIEIYDAADDRQSDSYIAETFPPNIVKVLNDIWQKLYNYKPFAKFDIQSILAEPESILYDDSLQDKFLLEPVSTKMKVITALVQKIVAGEIDAGEYFTQLLRYIVKEALNSNPSFYSGPIWALLTADPNRQYFDIGFPVVAKTRTFMLVKETRIGVPAMVFPLVLMTADIRKGVEYVQANPGADPTTLLAQLIFYSFKTKADNISDPLYAKALEFWGYAASEAGKVDVNTRASVVNVVTWAIESGWNFFQGQ